MKLKQCRGCERTPYFTHIMDDNGHQFVRAECECGRKSTYHTDQYFAAKEWNSISRKAGNK